MCLALHAAVQTINALQETVQMEGRLFAVILDTDVAVLVLIAYLVIPVIHTTAKDNT